MKAKSCLGLLSSAVLMALASVPVFANWSLSILDDYAEANGISDGNVILNRVIGSGYLSGYSAARQDCSSGATTELNASDCFCSRACGISGNQIVGIAYEPFGDSYAALWNGDSSGCVNLNPAGFYGSILHATSGSQQVGTAGCHAGLWSGSAASFVDLHPVGYNSSAALGVGDGQQVGGVDDTTGTVSQKHAALWNGTAASFVDLNPVGASSSTATGVSGGIQAGYTGGNTFENYDDPTVLGMICPDQHAALWHGTASSYVDLNPTGYMGSCARGLLDGIEFGGARGDKTGGLTHAGLWSGTADSFYDLGALMPGYNTMATGIYKSGNDIWVSGYAWEPGWRAPEVAVLWHYTPVPEPSSLIALMGGMIGMGGMVLRRRKHH